MPKPKRITQQRIDQLSNDLSENMTTGTAEEWRQVARHFRDRFDAVMLQLNAVTVSIAALNIAEEMRATALRELAEFLSQHRGQPRPTVKKKR